MEPVMRVVAFWLIALPAFADIVTLKDGRKFDGRLISEDDNAVKIRTPQGVKTFPRAQVENVRKQKSVYDTFDEKLAEAKDDVKALIKVGQWAASNKLYPEAVKTYQKVLSIDPNNAAAKKAVDGFDKQPIGSGGSGGGGSGERRLAVRGKQRPYYLHVPRSYGGQPTPVLLWLHADGRGSYIGALGPMADKYGFIIVSGEGGGTWRGWSEGKGSEDDEYLFGAIEETKKLYNVDLTRIYVAGHSRGGTYTSRLGADFPEFFAGAAMHNGVWVGNQNPGAKTPFFIYTGEKDYLAKEYGNASDHATKLGHEVKRKDVPGAGHESRHDMFDEMFRWFQTKTLPKRVLWGEE
jgi:predicted esterase